MNHYSSILAISFGFLVINLFINSDLINYSVYFLMGISLLSEKFAIFVDILWNKLSNFLSFIVPNILLTIIYFIVLTPIALLSKIFKAKTNYRITNPDDTTFIDLEKEYRSESFRDPW